MKVWLWIALAIILVVLYAISPLDAVPDLPGVGWVDDLFLIGVLIWFLMTRRPGESPGDFYRRYRGYKRPSTDQGQGRYKEKREEEAPSGNEEKDPFKILGVEPGASPDEIKVAYRKAVAKYHPDKVTHLGREFQEMAHKKLVVIQRAYEALMNK